MTTPHIDFEPTLIITHKGCPDGFGAAWALHQRYGDNVKYIEADYGVPPDIELLRGQRVVIADVAFPRDVMQEMVDISERFLLLDHHASQEQEVGDMEGMHFDMGHSGAALAWMAAHPGKDIPKMLQLIEDRDLWNFKIPHSKELLMVLDMQPKTFEAWTEFAQNLESKPDEVLKLGQILQAAQDDRLDKAAQDAFEVNWNGCKGLACNANHVDASFLGEKLYNTPGVDFALVFFHKSATKISCSFRSKVGGPHDGVALRLAQSFGGGGHPNAAGARMTPERFQEVLAQMTAPLAPPSHPYKMGR